MQNANEGPFIFEQKTMRRGKNCIAMRRLKSARGQPEAPCKLLNLQWRNNTARIGLWFGSNGANSIEVESIGESLGIEDTPRQFNLRWTLRNGSFDLI